MAAAIEDCGNVQGGGKVLITGGHFVIGSIVVTHSNLIIHLSSGSSLVGSTDEADYPLIDVLPSYGVGRDVPTDKRFRPLIFITNATNVSITGEGAGAGAAAALSDRSWEKEASVIDGRGQGWWIKHFEKKLNYSRPRLVECMFCFDFQVSDLCLRDSPFWTLHPYASMGVTVARVTVLAPGWAPNTDGVDPDSCSDVLIKDSVFKCGDDGVAIKSGLNEAGRNFNRPSEHIRIENITIDPEFDNGSTNGVSIGSEMSGGVFNVTVSGAHITGCAVGVYVKSALGRGGEVNDITFEDISMDRVLEPIRFAIDYPYRRRLRLGQQDDERGVPTWKELEEVGANEDDGGSGTPYLHNLAVRRLVAKGALRAGFFEGLEDSVIDGIALEDVDIDIATSLGFECAFATGTAVNVSPAPCFP